MATVGSQASHSPEPPKPKRKKRSNAGQRHRPEVRAGVWTAWQRQCEARPGLQLMSNEGDEALSLIVQCFALGTNNGKTNARRWIERGLSGLTLLRNAQGAGGATEKHKYPPVKVDVQKEICKRIQMKRTRSTAKTLSFINDWLQEQGRANEMIRSKETINQIVKRLELIWTPGHRRPRQAGQHELDGEIRVRYAKMMKQIDEQNQRRIAFSDEKIFALSETHKGGYWHPRNESPPPIREWQESIQWHVWGAVSWQGTLGPLIFLEAGTFKGQKAYDRDLECRSSTAVLPRGSTSPYMPCTRSS